VLVLKLTLYLNHVQAKFEIARNYMPKVGSFGLDMMFRTCMQCAGLISVALSTNKIYVSTLSFNLNLILTNIG
jgi:gamma-glutamylcysteine synthetase